MTFQDKFSKNWDEMTDSAKKYVLVDPAARDGKETTAEYACTSNWWVQYKIRAVSTLPPQSL